MSRPKDEPDAGLERAWSEGESIELDRTRPPTGVLSVRIPRDLMRALSERARSEGRPTSHVARELIENGLQGDHPSTPKEVARMFSRWVDEATKGQVCR